VMLVPDTGNKYLSKMYNDYWMQDQGFLETPSYGDLRDIISRPYSSHDTIIIGPRETLNAAYQRMKLYDVSQLPVIEDGRIIGIIDESDVLMAVYQDPSRFSEPVSSAMTSKLEFVGLKAAIDDLLPIFDAGKVAIVKEGDEFHGLITRIDLLNYLRRRDKNQ